jgi:hypothetical protein
MLLNVFICIKDGNIFFEKRIQIAALPVSIFFVEPFEVISHWNWGFKKKKKS